MPYAGADSPHPGWRSHRPHGAGRGRSPLAFVLGLLGLWLVGEAAGCVIAGMVLPFLPPGAGEMGDREILVLYGLAFVGGTIGVACALALARSFRPVGGAMHDLPGPMLRSRLAGVLVGGLGGGVVGGVIAG